LQTAVRAIKAGAEFSDQTGSAYHVLDNRRKCLLRSHANEVVARTQLLLDVGESRFEHVANRLPRAAVKLKQSQVFDRPKIRRSSADFDPRQITEPWSPAARSQRPRARGDPGARRVCPGSCAPRHSHPGEEIVYVVEGILEYQLDGKPPATLKAGDVLFIPAGTIHSVKNVGSGNAAEFATYIVEKGKPLVTLAK
jgi:quercetin dioxygenase-like cupin family protein